VKTDLVSSAGATLLRATWLILPVVLGGLGHVAVLKTNVLASLAVPIDNGARWRGRRLFGANKTWRGVVLMTGLTALTSGAQAALARRTRCPSAQQSARVNAWLTGALCGLTYCLAELPNSFVKRQLGIEPGARATRASRLQYVVDQADSVAGCLVALRLLYRAAAGELVTAFALGLTIHIGIDQLIYAMGIKSRRPKG
jgi:CDP-2,3-bis-(O-geranylgeranyl)-sn-glycerol synthase